MKQKRQISIRCIHSKQRKSVRPLSLPALSLSSRRKARQALAPWPDSERNLRPPHLRSPVRLRRKLLPSIRDRASRPAVKTARTEPVKPVSPAAREVKPNRPEGPRLQTAPAARKPVRSASGSDRSDRTVSGTDSERRAERRHPVPEIKERSGKVSDGVPEERSREAVPSGAEAGLASQKTEAASPPCRSEDGCRQARSDAGPESGAAF